MNTTLVIASRELRERSRIFLVALIMAILPFAISLMPGARSDRATVIMITGSVFAFALGFATSLGLGASVIGRELAEKRLSFLFSKPVSPAAIWAGKVLAALATSLGSCLIILVPAMLATRGARADFHLRWVLIGGVVSLFFIAHAVTTMVRSRSALIAVDFACALITAAVMYFVIRPLILGGALELAIGVVAAVAAALLAILAIAPVAQLSAGRTDIRRNHAALSRALWIPAGVVLAIAAAYTTWVVSIGPEDLNIYALTQSASSDVVLVAGGSQHRGDYTGAMIVDAKSGRYERIATPPWWGSDVSRDGTTLAWLQQPMPWSDGRELYVRRFDAVDAKSVATGINAGGRADLVLSDDGSRVAVSNGAALAVHDLRTGKLLASTTRLDGRARHAVYFATPDVVRVVEYEAARGAGLVTFKILELDLVQRKLAQTGQFTAQSANVPVSVSADGARMFVRADGLIVDARSGATLAQVAPAAGMNVSAMLRDGSVVRAMRGDTAKLAIYGSDGKLAHELRLPGAKMGWISGETTDGKLIVLGFGTPGEKHGKGRTMFLIDPARGAIERAVGNTKGPLPQWSLDPRLPQYRAGMKLAAIDSGGRIVEW